MVFFSKNNKERQRQNEGLFKINETADKLSNLIDDITKISNGLESTINNSLSMNLFGKTFINQILVEFSQTLLKYDVIILFKDRSEMEEYLKTLYLEFDSEEEDLLIYKSKSFKFSVSKQIFDKEKLIYMSKLAVDNFKQDKTLFELTSEEDFEEIPDDSDLPF